jgi:hypothetical protein
MPFRLRILAAALGVSSVLPAVETRSFEDSQAFLKQYCQGCHQGKTSAGGFDLARVGSAESLATSAPKWISAANRVRNGEMPPKGSPAPSVDARESFTSWVEKALRAEACSEGVTPGPAPIRRLNRDEYSATVRDLLNINLDVGRALPADGAGGEGFDNAAETLFLSPIHAEKYLEAARSALEFASTDSRARSRIFVARPGPDLQPEAAARQILATFLPRAFRRPVSAAETESYLALYREAQKQGDTFDRAVLFALRGILVSPQFLFRTEPANPSPEARPVDDYTLASRLSYFLWGTMPDELLFDLAEEGRLREPEVLKAQTGRMLRSPKSLAFADRFVGQWLRTRDLGAQKTLDPKLFPAFANDDELRSDMRYQPVLFFRELLTKNLPVLNLIDSKFTFTTRRLNKFYGFGVKLRRETPEMLHPAQLPEGSDRGGVLGMPAVLAVSSYPNRTSPVLRGAWVLDALLGTPPPPPPANVPKLEESAAAHPKSVRERLTQHRENPLCASCHNRIDPIGFALENYDPLGQWRSEDSGRPVDATAELTDGTKFEGPNELKRVLLERKDLFIRNLTNKMLGYALGRGLTLKDSCTVDGIVAKLEADEYAAQTLIEAIVFSMPFQYQAGAGAPAQRRTAR